MALRCSMDPAGETGLLCEVLLLQQCLLFPSPALSERGHRSLAGRGVPICHVLHRRYDLGDGPVPPQLRWRARRALFIDAADDLASGQHVIVLVLPHPGWGASCPRYLGGLSPSLPAPIFFRLALGFEGIVSKRPPRR